MAHLGIFCLPMPSHINLFLALARTLRDRGHRITFFAIDENANGIREAACEFQQLEPDTVPLGSLAQMMRQMSTMGNLASMRMQGRFDELRYEGILRKGPALVKAAKIDGLIVDQAEACTGSVAEVLGLPWVNVSNGLSPNSEPQVPPFFTSWSYSTRWPAIIRNKIGYSGVRIASAPIRNLINRYRKSWQLPPLGGFDDTFSPFAQICQQPREFDFPRRHLPPCFHYVGPIRSPSSRAIPFPWESLSGKPLVYASLGTVMNRNRALYRSIAEACAGLDLQLVLSLGGDNSRLYDDLPASPVVVGFAPQMELLARAALTITHAGLNTTLESLSHGVPLVAIPITFEQPGVAARIRFTGTGEFVRSSQATSQRIRALIERVLHDSSYREAAKEMQAALARTRGSTHAADLVEQVMETKQAVLASHGSQSSPPSST